MSTHDVPGANKANNDILAAGCWAEHTDGSLLFVKGTEADQVVYELYDVAQDPPVYYQDSMRITGFNQNFSYPPTGASSVEWTWHDKTPFPWSRVIRNFDKPTPMHTTVADTLSAAAKVAESLKLRAKNLQPSDIEAQIPQSRSSGRTIIQRLEDALNAFGN